MRKIVMLLLSCCVASILPTALPAQEQQFANLGDFKLESGETIHDCRIGYRTFGRLDEAKSNAVLFPTWFGGTSESLKEGFATAPLVNTSDYFVIVVDALANGVSSSPSNSDSQPRMKFPKISIRDMVNSEYQVVTGTLGIQHVRAVMGVSMGGMQSFEWMVAYPTFMDNVVPILGSPRLAPYDILLWQTNREAIESNPAWNHGDYLQNPSVVLEYELGQLMLTTPQNFNQHNSRKQFYESLAKAKDSPAFDANNKIRQLEAMMALDISRNFGGSMEKAAAAVMAKVLVIVNRQDHVVTPQPALDFAALLHARTMDLDSDCGHLATSCKGPGIAAAISSFLQSK
ncbi:MAG: alpha/beta fold hydrolase [Candidatus Acidiferrales bacterium]